MAKSKLHEYCLSEVMEIRLVASMFLLWQGLSCSAPITTEAEATSKALKGSFEMLEARVEGDALVLRIQYCSQGQDDFMLLSSGAPTKSLPRQVLLELHHNGSSNLSKSIVTEVKSFNLIPYRDPDNDVVHIRIKGLSEVLVYRYTQ